MAGTIGEAERAIGHIALQVKMAGGDLSRVLIGRSERRAIARDMGELKFSCEIDASDRSMKAHSTRESYFRDLVHYIDETMPESIRPNHGRDLSRRFFSTKDGSRLSLRGPIDDGSFIEGVRDAALEHSSTMLRPRRRHMTRALHISADCRRFSLVVVMPDGIDLPDPVFLMMGVESCPRHP